MNKIFCYGTLQDPQIQMELIDRVCIGNIDSIDGFVVLRDYVDPDDGIAYPRLVEMSNGCVYGHIYKFSDDEITKLDEYETEMYTRRYLKTNKGELVQVYLPVKLTF
jgi:gamma-glutamylcyclotransferase (GGCT)/AIG2-like uncharacterized protein YtfP